MGWPICRFGEGTERRWWWRWKRWKLRPETCRSQILCPNQKSPTPDFITNRDTRRYRVHLRSSSTSISIREISSFNISPALGLYASHRVPAANWLHQDAINQSPLRRGRALPHSLLRHRPHGSPHTSLAQTRAAPDLLQNPGCSLPAADLQCLSDRDGEPDEVSIGDRICRCAAGVRFLEEEEGCHGQGEHGRSGTGSHDLEG